MPKRSSSGVAVNNFVRNIFSCVGSVVAQPLIDAIGDGWVFTGLGVICWISGFSTIWAMKKFGPRWRIEMDKKLNHWRVCLRTPVQRMNVRGQRLSTAKDILELGNWGASAREVRSVRQRFSPVAWCRVNKAATVDVAVLSSPRFLICYSASRTRGSSLKQMVEMCQIAETVNDTKPTELLRDFGHCERNSIAGDLLRYYSIVSVACSSWIKTWIANKRHKFQLRRNSYGNH